MINLNHCWSQKTVPVFLPTSCSDFHYSKKLWLAILWIMGKHKKSEVEKALSMEGRIQVIADLSLLAEVLIFFPLEEMWHKLMP